MSGSVIAAVIAAASSSAVSIALIAERYWREKQQDLLRALEYLTGGSQKRSVGIALIEGYWYEKHPNHRAIIPALTNQAIYLLLETESRGRHQFHNWLRIMDLILRVPPEPSLRDFYIELIEALEVRATDDADAPSGIKITAMAASRWSDRVREAAGLPPRADDIDPSL